MENNKEETKDKTVSIEIKDGEIFSLGCLIDIIVDYYGMTKAENDSSESWKKGTEYEAKGMSDVPKEVDALIESAFKKQLKKFTE